MVFLNGKLMAIEDAKVSVLDRGFIFGDGVYELVPVYSRVPFRLDEHLARLERSLGETRIRNPYSRAQWREFIFRLIDAQDFDDQGIYWLEEPITIQNTRMVIMSGEYNTFWIKDIDKVGQRYSQEYPRAVKSRLCSFITISRQL